MGLRSLIAKLHPPLPLNPRESQKLLNLLTASFREQLNLQHPQDYSQRPCPADTHIHSLLSSPLLKGRKSTERFERSTERNTPKPNMLEEVQSSLIAPMEFFDAQVAAGQATIDTAKNCLRTQLANTTIYKEVMPGGLPPSNSEALASILNWLWSSGMEHSLEFVHDHQFVRLLMGFVVSEGKQRHFWQWLERAAIVHREHETLQGKPDNDLIRSIAHLVQAYLHENLKTKSDLNIAMAIFLKALSLLDMKLFPCYNKLLKAPASYLSRRIMDRDLQVILDVTLYDRLVEKVKVWSKGEDMVLARLRLSHPVNPDPSPALRYIRTTIESTPKFTSTSKKSFVLLCLNTAKVLLEEQRYEDASWMIQTIQDNFTKEIGETLSTVKRPSQDDRLIDLRSLEALATI